VHDSAFLERPVIHGSWWCSDRCITAAGGRIIYRRQLVVGVLYNHGLSPTPWCITAAGWPGRGGPAGRVDPAVAAGAACANYIYRNAVEMLHNDEML
jgi:hypothetical protein